jgi:hypothetical protein
VRHSRRLKRHIERTYKYYQTLRKLINIPESADTIENDELQNPEWISMRKWWTAICIVIVLIGTILVFQILVV